MIVVDVTERRASLERRIARIDGIGRRMDADVAPFGHADDEGRDPSST